MVEHTANRGITVQLVGGPTALVTYGGLRLLTDPTFDPPGDYERGPTILRKLDGPAIPADHGDAELAPRNGPVIGFVLQAQDQPALYVSGDNASVDVVEEIADRLGPIPVAVLFTGAANVPEVHGDVHVTLTAENAVRAAQALAAQAVIPIHNHGWRHFTEGAADVRDAFARAGLSATLLVPAAGETVSATASIQPPAGPR